MADRGGMAEQTTTPHRGTHGIANYGWENNEESPGGFSDIDFSETGKNDSSGNAVRINQGNLGEWKVALDFLSLCLTYVRAIRQRETRLYKKGAARFH